MLFFYVMAILTFWAGLVLILREKKLPAEEIPDMTEEEFMSHEDSIETELRESGIIK